MRGYWHYWIDCLYELLRWLVDGSVGHGAAPMIQNEEVGAASLVLAKAIDQRAEYLRNNKYDPQVLVNLLTSICAELYACIDPDELEREQ